MKILRLIPFLLLAISLVLSNGCKKDNISSDSGIKLRFQTDTLTFDTIFTTLPSTTKRLKIFNDSKSRVSISSIDLAGGSTSNFRLNIDGVTGPNQKDVEINAKDSIYIFVEVTVDINNTNNPLLITDSIQFVTNGNKQKVVLAAAGQDSHLINGQKIGTQTWTNDKPYVILNSVLVDAGATLNIQAGTRIYFGNNSGLYVSGSLIVNGTCTDSVTFRGLRLEEFYKDIPGQWSGIFILRESGDCTIDHAVIKNSTYGLNMGNTSSDDLSLLQASNKKVTLKNSVIKNSLSTALFAFFWNADISNCLIYNAGDNMVNFVCGGNYKVDQCTMVNYGSTALNHEKAILQMSNVASNSARGQIYQSPLDIAFTNTILDGSLDEEFLFSVDTGTGNYFHYQFTNSLVKTKTTPPADTLLNTLKNVDPTFKNRSIGDYHLSSGSPCINYGKTGLGIASDLDCKPYLATPAIGCYEFVQ